MTQATGARSLCNVKVEYKIGESWVDISGYANTVEPSAAARKSGETWTADGDTPIVTFGKQEPRELDVTIVYTEGSTDPFKVLRDHFEKACGSPIQVRYSPGGGDTDDMQFTTSATYGAIIEFNDPGGEVDTGDPLVISFKVKTSDIADSYVIAEA
ncbi:MAG: hypothetical protein JXA14_26100 [Anaerolineae bacterium]|nr:hypothetical protein [Anaerolineae bacterium]